MQKRISICLISSKLKAPKLGYAEHTFQHGDPKELFIAINELAYDITVTSKNGISACYWVEWVIEFEQLCKKRKEPCLAVRRTFAPVLEKYQTDPIWIVWDVLLYEATSRNNVLLSKVMNSLIDIFSIKYTGGVKKRRRFVLYYAISMLTEAVDFSVDIVQKPLIVKKVVEKVNNVYKDVKKNELSPNTIIL